MVREGSAAVSIAAAAILVYARMLTAGFVLDDVPLIVENTLLRAWSDLPRLLTTEYWTAALGHTGRFAYWRPVSSLYFFMGYRLGDGAAPLFHATGVLLHAAVCVLLYFVLKRDWNAKAAFAAALAFAVLPVHVDAVANIASNTEVLALLAMLGAWWLLGTPATNPRRTILGLGCFALALGCKEASLLFPFAFAAADWTLSGRRPDDRGRRTAYLGMLALVAAYLLGRWWVAGLALKGGKPYFDAVFLPVKLFTMAAFVIRHYAVPLVTGAFQCADFTAPLLPFLPPSDPWGWLSFLAVLGATLLTFQGLRHRGPWAFWMFLSGLFLLPTSHLLSQTDTIGAERFLYTPSLAWCAAVGWVYAERSRSARLAVAALLLWYAGRTVARSAIWKDELSFFRASVAENPVAAGPRYSLGVALLKAGQTDEGERELNVALELDPEEPGIHYNLGRLAWDRGDFPAAEKAFSAALSLQPDDPDTLVALGLLAEKRGDRKAAAGRYSEALKIRPWDVRARSALTRVSRTR